MRVPSVSDNGGVSGWVGVYMGGQSMLYGATGIDNIFLNSSFWRALAEHNMRQRELLL